MRNTGEAGSFAEKKYHFGACGGLDQKTEAPVESLGIDDQRRSDQMRASPANIDRACAALEGCEDKEEHLALLPTQAGLKRYSSPNSVYRASDHRRFYW